MRYSWPTEISETCYVVAINKTMLPYVAGALRFFEKRGSWATYDDYERGSAAFAELQNCMTATCLTDLVESNDRLYRLLDTALFGTEYSVTTLDPLLIEPAIPPTRDLAIADAASLLGRMRDQTLLLDNAYNGAISASYSRPTGIRDALQTLLDDLAAEALTEADQLARLAEIAGLLV